MYCIKFLTWFTSNCAENVDTCTDSTLCHKITLYIYVNVS